MSQENGIIHLWDLPIDKVCIKLPDVLQKEMVKTALSILSGRCKLAYKIGVKPINIYDFEESRFRSITLSVVKRLSNFLVMHGFKEFSLENLETKLELIKAKFVGISIFNPKFPISFSNTKGSQIIAGILGDGGITTALHPIYTNKEECLVDKFLENIKEVIGDIEFARSTKRKCGNLFRVILPKTIGYILVYGLGIPGGMKTFTNPQIPSFILNGKSEIQIEFLRQFFNDESKVFLGTKGGGRKSITVTQSNFENEPPKRLLQVKKMLEGFDVRVSGPYFHKEHISNDGYASYHWTIQITNQRDIETFAERIGFSLPTKRKILEELIESYVTVPRFKRGTKFDEVLKVCKELKKENKKITIKNIANKVNRSVDYVGKLTRELVRQRRLRLVKYKFHEKEFELIE